MFYAIVVGGGWLGMYVGPVRLLNLALAGIALLVWLVVAARRPEWRPTTAIWPAFVAALAAFSLSVVGSSYQRLGLEMLALAILLTALYLLLVRIMALPYARARIGGLMAALALVMGLAYVGWTVVLWVEWWGLVGELRLPPFRPTQLGLTWGSASVLLTVQVLMTAAAAGGLGFATRGARITISVLVVLLAAVAVISGSRSGWLSLAGATVIVASLALMDARGRDLVARGLRSRPMRLAIVPVVIAGITVASLFGPAMIDRLAGSGDGGRPTYWATALRMFEEAPLLGQGPGTWMVRRIAFTHTGEMDLYMPHAHNQYFQTAAELGLMGLAAGLVAFGAVAWLLYGALRGRDAMRRRWAWASLFGLVYLALDVVVDVHTIVTVPLLIGIPVAVLDATTERGIGIPSVLLRLARPLRALAVAGLVVASAVALVYLARSEAVALTHQRAVAAMAEGEWGDAVAPANEAAAADPDIGAYQLTAALAAAATGDWETAETAFRRVTEIDGLPTAWLGLATAQVELGRPVSQVSASLAEAQRLGDQQAALMIATGELYDRIGLPEQADEAYARTLAMMPSLAADGTWRDALGDERVASIVEDAISASTAVAWEIALMAGDVARSRVLAAIAPQDASVDRFIDAWSGDQIAVAEVQAAADAEPMNPERLAYAARVSDRAGDDEAAARYGRLMRLGPHYGPTTVNVGFGLRDPSRDAATGMETYYYGTYTYRRAMPLDLLVPGLPGLVVPEDPDVAP